MLISKITAITLACKYWNKLSCLFRVKWEPKLEAKVATKKKPKRKSLLLVGQPNNRNWQLANIRLCFPLLFGAHFFSISLPIQRSSYWQYVGGQQANEIERRFGKLSACLALQNSGQEESWKQNNDMNCVRQIGVVRSFLMIPPIFCYWTCPKTEQRERGRECCATGTICAAVNLIVATLIT